MASRADGPIWVSRALAPSLRDPLIANFGARALPVVRGKTAVPEELDGTVILGHPNYLGRFEAAPVARTIWLAGRWSGLRAVPGGGEVVVTGRRARSDAARNLVDAARFVAKRLRQVRGVDLLSMPEVPVLVVQASFDPPPRLTEVPGVSLLSTAFPELPGSVRLSLPGDVTGPRSRRYADAVVAALTKESSCGSME